MTLVRIEDVPRDAEHVPEFDLTLPNGSLMQQFRQEVAEGGVVTDVVYQRLTARDGTTTAYRLDPDAGRTNR